MSANTDNCSRSRNLERGDARVGLLMLASLLLGTAVGAFWTYHKLGPPTGNPPPEMTARSGALLPSTSAVLSSLTAPLELRFYSVLDSAGEAPELKSFAARVDALLKMYQQEANGKLTVTRSNAVSYANANAAMADGMAPFNEAKGEPSFLGIAVIGNGKKAVLAQLAPEWEPALEYDLTRAILSVSKRAQESAASVPPPNVNPAMLEEVKRTIPNLESVSLADASRMVREASLKEFATLAAQMQTRLKEAEQRLKDAQSGGSEAEQQAAMKNLQELQAEQADQLTMIGVKAEAQIQALKTLKAGGQ